MTFFIDMHRYAIACLMLGQLAGCALGPDYQRPDIDTPSGWRVETRDPADLANTMWWEKFQDPVLNELIRVALQENKDLRIAAFRVEEFKARVQVSRAGYFPQLGYGGSAIRERFSENRPIPLPIGVSPLNNTYQIGASLGWELDVWGRIRRANEATLAELLSAEENRSAVILTLVSDVASSYIQLLSLDKALEISRLTLANRAEWLRLFERKYAGGAISKLELAQARSAYEEAAAAIPSQERQIATLENALSVLLGKNPGPIRRDGKLETLAIPPVPQGIPSDILARRPDVRQAEQELIAANARIGVAKTQYFPAISLTGLFGYASTELSTLLDNASSFGALGAVVSGPIFSGGRITGEVRQTEAVQKQILSKYLRTIQTAFREVEDALVSNQKFGEQFIALGRQVSALQEYVVLARKRHEGGFSNFIEVLDAERNLYAVEIAQVQTQRDEYLALIAVYKSMGGGWLQDSETTDRVSRQASDQKAYAPLQPVAEDAVNSYN
jgi:multidrug efflux system outer membrane protein